MSSTRSLYPQVVSRLLASFRAAKFRVSPGQLFFVAGSIPGSSTKTADEPKLGALGEDQAGSLVLPGQLAQALRDLINEVVLAAVGRQHRVRTTPVPAKVA
jgi:hypothetical protein